MYVLEAVARAGVAGLLPLGRSEQEACEREGMCDRLIHLYTHHTKTRAWYARKASLNSVYASDHRRWSISIFPPSSRITPERVCRGVWVVRDWSGVGLHEGMCVCIMCECRVGADDHPSHTQALSVVDIYI
jgi:hypothetical protein